MASSVCKPDARNAAAGAGNSALSLNEPAVLHHRFQPDIRHRRGENAPANRQHFARELDRFLKVARDRGERRQKEVSEAVPLQAASAGETELKQAGEKTGVLGERHHAVADIARRQHLEIAPQPPRASAVIGHRDHSGQVADPAGVAVGYHSGAMQSGAIGSFLGVFFQSLQQGGKAGAPADGNNPHLRSPKLSARPDSITAAFPGRAVP
jgi:hypothetical protein